MMCEHKAEKFRIAHEVIEKMTHEELVVSLIRSGLLRQYEIQINELEQQLAAANARILSYEQQLGEYAKGANDDIRYWRQRAAQAEAQNKRMREFLVEIQSYSETYLDLDSRMKHIIDCAKAALEGKP